MIRTFQSQHFGLMAYTVYSAAQAWNRNDARAAKALSLRGQSENDLMRKYHREAARLLYEERNKHSDSPISQEMYVDLHGLHPEEATEYLENALLEQQSSSKPVYVVVGTGHHSKGGKDKVGKAVRTWLDSWRYAWREFSAGGDKDGLGGIIGVDPRTFDKASTENEKREVKDEAMGEVGTGKIRILKKEDKGKVR